MDNSCGAAFEVPLVATHDVRPSCGFRRDLSQQAATQRRATATVAATTAANATTTNAAFHTPANATAELDDGVAVNARHSADEVHGFVFSYCGTCA